MMSYFSVRLLCSSEETDPDLALVAIHLLVPIVCVCFGLYIYWIFPQSQIITPRVLSGIYAVPQNMLRGLPVHFIRFDN